MSVRYGKGVSDESELRLLHDLGGKKLLEVGVADDGGSVPNAVELALQGIRVVTIDPDAERLDRVRSAAESAETHVSCKQVDLADLGFATSASFDAAMAVHTLHRHDDLPRLLRQVHRVLKSNAPFVVAVAHPVAAMFDHDGAARRRYGADGTFAELYMSFERTNFHFDAIHELMPGASAVAPTVLVVRARKVGN